MVFCYVDLIFSFISSSSYMFLLFLFHLILVHSCILSPLPLPSRLVISHSPFAFPSLLSILFSPLLSSFLSPPPLPSFYFLTLLPYILLFISFLRPLLPFLLCLSPTPLPACLYASSSFPSLRLLFPFSFSCISSFLSIQLLLSPLPIFLFFSSFYLLALPPPLSSTPSS